LKRGFSFFHHRFGEPFTGDRSDQLLVAASPHDAVADTHWYRADFDQLLIREAERAGVEYWEHTTIDSVSFSKGGATLAGLSAKRPLQVRARLLIDASGPRGFLHGMLRLGEEPFADFPATQALYSHFSGVREFAEITPHTSDDVPPFPLDAAAVHHVFPGGWIWVLRFNNGITSAGVAATESLAGAVGLGDGERGWQRLLQRLPAVREQFAGSARRMEFRHMPRVAFRSRHIAGAAWALLPSAAGFVDPLLSTGFPLALQGITRIAEMIEHDWNSGRMPAKLSRYEVQTGEEFAAAADLIGALYANLDDFPLFAALSRIYFVAASFSECARRLGRPELAGSFLMHDVPAFGSHCRRLFRRARERLSDREKAGLIVEIERFIEPFDVAGLCDRSRRNWHPASADDLLGNSGKLGGTPVEIQAMLHRCGFAGPMNDAPGQ
jgi:FADH2 O2-dependent halogenase